MHDLDAVLLGKRCKIDDAPIRITPVLSRASSNLFTKRPLFISHSTPWEDEEPLRRL